MSVSRGHIAAVLRQKRNLSNTGAAKSVSRPPNLKPNNKVGHGMLPAFEILKKQGSKLPPLPGFPTLPVPTLPGGKHHRPPKRPGRRPGRGWPSFGPGSGKIAGPR